MVCNFRTFVVHFISPIWLKFGMVLFSGPNWEIDTKKFRLFLLTKKLQITPGLPVLAHQYGGSKVIFDLNSSSIVKIPQHFMIFIKIFSPPFNTYYEKYGKYLVLTKFYLNVVRSFQAALNDDKIYPNLIT